MQNDTLGHRGRENDPLYRARRRLVMAAERLTDDGRERLMGLLRAGDPRREAWFAWNAKEIVRQVYDHTDHTLAIAWVDEIVRDVTDREMPIEVRRLGRTIGRWRDQIVAWHRSHVSNGPTEAVQLGEARQACRVRDAQLRPLPDPRSALRRPAELGHPPSHHPTLKRGAPQIPGDKLASEQVKALVKALNEIVSLLADAEPADKTDLYDRLGISLAYDPDGSVTVESRPRGVQVRVGGGT